MSTAFPKGKTPVIQTVEDQELTVDQAQQVIQAANEASGQLRQMGPAPVAKLYEAFLKSANQQEFRKAIQMFGGGWKKFATQNPKLVGGFFRIARELNTVLTDRNFNKLFSEYLQEVSKNIAKQIDNRMMELSETQIRGKSMWCADGAICKLPKGSKGIDWGYGGSRIFDDAQLYVESDDNIIFKTGGKDIMAVNNNGVNIRGDLNLDGRINIAGWKVEGGPDNSLVFRRGDATGEPDQPFLRMGQDGNLWVSRSTYRGWIPDNISGHTHKYWEPAAGGKKSFTGNASEKWQDPGNKFQGN